MTLDLLEQPSDASTLVSGENLLGMMQRILSSRTNVRIILPVTNDEIAVFPLRGEFYAKVSDMAAFCHTPIAQLEQVIIDEAVPAYSSAPGKPISDLLWGIGFHVSRGNLIEGCSKYDVVQFKRWPNLTRLPVTPNSARICALLTRRPTTVMLIHRMLGIDKEEVYQNYSAAYCAGLVNAISRNLESGNPESELAAMPELPKARGLFHSLFAKISRL